ncbi:LPXTG cell wall anchor domain-containing protein [Micromonospora citrea]|uniref:LPXTG cell wall anchor domain-containing protein n=1 Tax=Micromonospora citrea TaxID=47855 RepID=UPI003C3A9CCE
MTLHPYARLALGAAILGVGVVAAPAAAVASSTPETAKLAAVTEQDPDTGRNKKYLVGPDEVAPVVLGVTNIDEKPVDGVVVQVRVFNDLDLTRRYDNCWYSTWTNQDAAWCEFSDVLEADATLALTASIVRTAPNARADQMPAVVFRWASKEWADARGGVEALAKADALPGTEVERGTDGTLRLEPRSLPLPETPRPINFAYVGLTTPSPEPTGSPTASPTAVPTGSPSAPATTTPSAGPTVPGGEDGGEGGGLPVTGAGTATLAGVGAVLLLLGGGGFLVARRRRTRFVACRSSRRPPFPPVWPGALHVPGPGPSVLSPSSAGPAGGWRR